MEQLFGAIPAVLNSLDANAQIDEAVVFAAWKRSAGKLLSERAVSLRFVETRLVIALADDMWRRHMEDLSPQLLVKLNRLLGPGTVTFIEFAIDAKAVNDSRESKALPPIEGQKPVKIDASLAKAASAIGDKKLREQFITTAATYLERQKQLKYGR